MKKRNNMWKLVLEDILVAISAVGISVSPAAHKYTVSEKSVAIEIPVKVEKPFYLPIPKSKRPEYISRALEKVELPWYINPEYLEAKILTESTWDPMKESPVGAKGLGQIMEKTWEDYEKKIPYSDGVFNPEVNLDVTLKHIIWQVRYCEQFHPYWNNLTQKEKLDILSAGYNAGIPSLHKKEWNISKTSAETRNHVKKINRALERS